MMDIKQISARRLWIIFILLLFFPLLFSLKVFAFTCNPDYSWNKPHITPTNIGPFPESGEVVFFYSGNNSRKITLKYGATVKDFVVNPVDKQDVVNTGFQVAQGELIQLLKVDDNYSGTEPEYCESRHICVGWIPPVFIDNKNKCGSGLLGPPTGGVRTPYPRLDIDPDIAWAETYRYTLLGSDKKGQQCWGDWREWEEDLDFDDFFIQFAIIPNEEVVNCPGADYVIDIGQVVCGDGCMDPDKAHLCPPSQTFSLTIPRSGLWDVKGIVGRGHCVNGICQCQDNEEFRLIIDGKNGLIAEDDYTGSTGCSETIVLQDLGEFGLEAQTYSVQMVSTAPTCSYVKEYPPNSAHLNTICLYEESDPQPNVSLFIHPEGEKTSLSFNSLNHTGGGIYKDENGIVTDDSVNDFTPFIQQRYDPVDKLFYMDATFTDDSLPIEAAYVWFDKTGNKPVTPMLIDLDNDKTPEKYGTKDKEGFGFMIHNNSGVWVPYIPAISGDGDSLVDVWKQASNGYSEQIDGKTVISIPGPNGIIAKVLLYSIESFDSDRRIKVRFSLSFKQDGGNLLPAPNLPIEGNYKIWLMANDTFGFTPFSNPEKIRYYDQWNNTLQSWNLNFDKPIVYLSFKPEGVSNIRVNWSFTPDTSLPLEFSASVINLYQSSDLNIENVYFNGIEFKPEIIPSDIDTRKIGSLDINVEKYLIKISADGGNGSGLLSFGSQEVGQGKLHFYLTGFDKGGNVGKTNRIDLDLRDWLITQGGLLYSNSVDISVDHPGDVSVWNNKTLLKNIPYDVAGLSSELIGIKSEGPLEEPKKSETVHSYMIRTFSTPDPVLGYYDSLRSEYEKRKNYISKYEFSSISASGKLSEVTDFHSDKIGVFQSSTSLNLGTTGTPFTCNGNAIFFIGGDLNINGKIANGTSTENRDACIFVVKGNVNINQGANVSASGVLAYDEVNAYILSDGNIKIGKDTYGDGLYISGGIHSHVENGVEFKRSLKVADRLRFPALVVNHHSKYGMLAGRIFGKELIIQSTEVGLKPY